MESDTGTDSDSDEDMEWDTGPDSDFTSQISTLELRTLLARILDSINSSDQFSLFRQTKDFAHLPKDIQAWLRGQSRALFKDIPSFPIESLEKTCYRLRSHSCDKMEADEMVIFILEAQRDWLAKLRESPIEDLLFYSFWPDDRLSVQCYSCKARLPNDDILRWSRLNPNLYIAREPKCNSCGMKRSLGIPQNKEIRSTRASRDRLQRRKREPTNRWKRCVRDDIDCHNLQPEMRTWCWKCKVDAKCTPQSEEGNTKNDPSPRRITGNPPKYIMRSYRCYNCFQEGSKFIPVENIQSVTVQWL